MAAGLPRMRRFQYYIQNILQYYVPYDIQYIQYFENMMFRMFDNKNTEHSMFSKFRVLKIGCSVVKYT